MNPAQQEILQQFKLLNQKAVDDFDVFFEQTGKKMCNATYSSITALSHLYCFSTSLSDLLLPLNKPYKFIFSSWVQAALYQVVHEGLLALNVAHEHLHKIASNTSRMAEAMVRNIHCVIMLQDDPRLTVISPEFIESVKEVKKLLQIICPKFQAIVNLTTELIETIREANICSPAVRDTLLLTLADISVGFNNSHHMWTWIAETIDITMATLNANIENEIKTQTVSDAYKSAHLTFQSAVLLTIYADICKDFGIQLLSMDELVVITLLPEASDKQAEIQSSIAQLTNINDGAAQNTFKQYLSDSEDISKAATSTMNGHLKITLVRTILYTNQADCLFAKLSKQETPDFNVVHSDMIWNYTFPNTHEFEKPRHTAHFKIDVHERDASKFLWATGEFVLSSLHLDSLVPVTLTQPLIYDVSRKAGDMTVRVSTYKFSL